MKYITKLKLASVHQLCDAEDRSTEYMLQVMQDTCKVELDTCVAYMDLGDAEHSKLFSELNSLVEVVVATENFFSRSNIENIEEEKETYTNEQMREALKLSKKIRDDESSDLFYTDEEIIQSLKQPKKD